MIFVDTSFFIALAQPRDSLHIRARAWGAHLRDRFVSTEYVLMETANALSKPVDRLRAAKIARLMRGSSKYVFVSANDDWLNSGLGLHESRPETEWSLTDCISFGVMQRHGITRALTHDHHFEQAGFEALLRRDPP